MTPDEMTKVIVFLTDKIEKLEQQKLCQCEETTQATPAVKYTSNYDEDEECISCSA
mgnify:CR=1 FL=1